MNLAAKLRIIFVTLQPIMENQHVSPILALQQQRLLLQMEYQAEKEAFRKQTEEMGLQRKVKRGDAW